jgi:methylmalonyl-CoA mutase cobalamin-binding domain/chain
MSDLDGKEASRAIDARRESIAETLTELNCRRFPELMARFGAYGREKCLQDNRFHLAYLSEALTAELPSLFADYVAWAKVMLEQRGVSADDLATALHLLRETLAAELAPGPAAAAAAYVGAGLERLADTPSDLPSLIEPDNPYVDLAHGYLEALLVGDRHAASRMVLDAVEGGMGVRDVYLHVFQPVQHEIGRLWQTNRISVAQEHFCTAATQLVMSQLYPRIFATEKNGRRLVATCVADNLHEIGVRMVSDFFELEGWDTFYLGANVPSRDVVRTVVDRAAHVLAVSATMTWHVRTVAELVEVVRADARCADVTVLVGGAVFRRNEGLWRKVGANGFAPDAEAAVELANRLVGAREG